MDLAVSALKYLLEFKTCGDELLVIDLVKKLQITLAFVKHPQMLHVPNIPGRTCTCSNNSINNFSSNTFLLNLAWS